MRFGIQIKLLCIYIRISRISRSYSFHRRDGSKIAGCVGFGVAISESEVLVKDLSYGLQPHETVLQEELIAIIKPIGGMQHGWSLHGLAVVAHGVVESGLS